MWMACLLDAGGAVIVSFQTLNGGLTVAALCEWRVYLAVTVTVTVTRGLILDIYKDLCSNQ